MGTATMPPVTADPTEHEEDDGQVRVSTDALEQIAAAARALHEQLPLFEGARFPAGVIAFGGSLEYPLSTEDNRALHEALRLGRRVVVRLSIGEDDDARTIALDAEVTARSFAFKGADGIPTTTSKVQINGRRLAEKDETDGGE